MLLIILKLTIITNDNILVIKSGMRNQKKTLIQGYTVGNIGK